MKTNIKLIIIVAISIFNTKISMAGNPFSSNYCFLEFIEIEGATNISRFNLIYDNDLNLKENNAVVALNDSQRIVEFKIPVHKFKGTNHIMESDFRELLDANNHPVITVGIDNKIFETLSKDTHHKQVEFVLTIAGETKKIIGEYSPVINDNNNIVIKGKTKLNLTDFSIIPPQKMFGMLQVKDSIIIKFDILITDKI